MRTGLGLLLVRRVLPVAVVLLIVLSAIPQFFSAYRSASFDTAPRDDYAPYLLAMTGLTGDGPRRQEGLFPGAPMAHRPLAVAAALPAYLVLPFYAFSELEEVDEPYLRATAALVFVGWLCMLLTVPMVYAIARHRHGCSRVASYVAALLTFLVSEFVALSTGDTMAILLIALLVYFIDRPAIVVPLVLVSAFTNEKIVIVAVVLFGARLLAWLAARRPARGFAYRAQLLASIAALATYALFRQVLLPRPGGEHAGQLDPSTWPANLLETIDLTLSLKGVVTNGIPIAVVLIMVTIAWVMAPRLRGRDGSFQRSDVLVALAMVVTAAFIGAEYTVGRLPMHTFPIYLPMLAVLVDMHVRAGGIVKPLRPLAPGG